MSAPTPSLSQLTTTFIGNSSLAIPQIVQVAIFSIKKYTQTYDLKKNLVKINIIVNTTKENSSVKHKNMSEKKQIMFFQQFLHNKQLKFGLLVPVGLLMHRQSQKDHPFTQIPPQKKCCTKKLKYQSLSKYSK